MSTEDRITKLESAVVDIASELAFTLRHLKSLAEAVDTDEVRLSDQNRISTAAERLDLIAESLRP